MTHGLFPVALGEKAGRADRLAAKLTPGKIRVLLLADEAKLQPAAFLPTEAKRSANALRDDSALDAANRITPIGRALAAVVRARMPAVTAEPFPVELGVRETRILRELVGKPDGFEPTAAATKALCAKLAEPPLALVRLQRPRVHVTEAGRAWVAANPRPEPGAW